ncbi:hypothetical protein [Hydrogenophaga luteola]|uniref:Uncharacterized protein n=1 Tax=Hydrogenophaga luteola TaxID=1591122 RepID=A0ABV7W9Z8_9BURK
MKNLIYFCMLVIPSLSGAQWAVYDDQVLKEIRKINNVGGRGIDKLKDFEKFENLDVDFSRLASLTEAEKAKYLGTKEDCGDEKLNAKHFEACQGLRNLRIQTLKQSQSVLHVLDDRRKAIDKLIADARNNTNQESGIMQRYHFELQGLHVQMQSDAFKLQVLMDGYKQREKAYEMQMAEARRVSDTRPNSLINLGPVPFVPPPR